MRQGQIERSTNETQISVSLSLDGQAEGQIATGVGFFDHMLEQISRHGGLDLTVKAEGDLHIDSHHTVEDCGYAIGTALKQAIGDSKGITRYGHAYLPMDEALSRAAVDVSGRAYLYYDVPLTIDRLGDMDCELFQEFFRSFSQAAGITLHIETLHGSNNHHMIESVFKAVGRALRMALTIDPRENGRIPSTKGTLSGAVATVKG